MLAAFLATLLFALSVVFASRTTRVLGGLRANLYRLLVATVLLGVWAHAWGGGWGGGGFSWFFLSGCIGFGLGDLALYLSLPRIGPRLAGLLVQCLAPPFAALAEWLWMGTIPTRHQALAGTIILTGVAIAVAPGDHLRNSRRALLIGVAFGLVAALGQGLGAVVSRKAYAVIHLGGGHVDGLTAAYQRILGGLLIAVPPTLWGLLRQPRIPRKPPPKPGDPPASSLVSGPLFSGIWVWVVLNALAGPAIGVGCYQWALASTPSAVVLPIVATMPILVIPLAWGLEGDRPGRRSIVGGLVAVAGAILMTL